MHNLLFMVERCKILSNTLFRGLAVAISKLGAVHKKQKTPSLVLRNEILTGDRRHYFILFDFVPADFVFSVS